MTNKFQFCFNCHRFHRLTGDLAMGGIVGVARETMSASPSIVVPKRIRARRLAPLGARVSSPILASLKLQSPSPTVPPKK